MKYTAARVGLSCQRPPSMFSRISCMSRRKAGCVCGVGGWISHSFIFLRTLRNASCSLAPYFLQTVERVSSGPVKRPLRKKGRSCCQARAEVLRASVRPDGGEQFPDLAFPDARGVHADGGFHVGQREFQHDPFNGLPGLGQLVRGKAHDLGAQGGQGFQDGLGVAAGARIHAGDLFILVVKGNGRMHPGIDLEQFALEPFPEVLQADAVLAQDGCRVIAPRLDSSAAAMLPENQRGIAEGPPPAWRSESPPPWAFYWHRRGSIPFPASRWR